MITFWLTKGLTLKYIPIKEGGIIKINGEVIAWQTYKIVGIESKWNPPFLASVEKQSINSSRMCIFLLKLHNNI